MSVGLPENGESRNGKHDTGIHHLNHIFCKILESDSSVERRGEGERESTLEIPNNHNHYSIFRFTITPSDHFKKA